MHTWAEDRGAYAQELFPKGHTAGSSRSLGYVIASECPEGESTEAKLAGRAARNSYRPPRQLRGASRILKEN